MTPSQIVAIARKAALCKTCGNKYGDPCRFTCEVIRATTRAVRLTLKAAPSSDAQTEKGEGKGRKA